MLHRQRRGVAGFLGFLVAGAAAYACSSEQSGNSSTATDGGSTGATSGAGGSTAEGGLTLNGGSSAHGGSNSQGGSTTSVDADASAGGASPAGSSCSQADDCQSGKCDGGRCMPSVALPNTTCSTGPDCASGLCVSGTCKIPAGASGTVDQSECAAGSLGCKCQPGNKCKPGLTCTDALCEPKGGPTGAGGSSGGSTGGACKPGVVGPVITECGYPYASSNPLTNILFNESSVLAAVVPSGGYPFASIQLFYNDEHAMTLGVRETVINGVSKSFPVSPLTKSPDIVNSPQTGTNLIIGQQTGVDPVGRPMWPALFITDITRDPNAVAGDWQWGGAPVNPTYVAGTWKGAVRTVDASGASITPDADPAKNNLDYGNGHTAPAGSITKAEAFGTEVRWDVRLEPGHNYRFQVMVHDGDQNKVGGDSGEACITFCADNTCPEGLQACTADGDCTNGDACTEGCCMPPPPAPPPPPSSSDAGACPDTWKLYTKSSGESVCTPPPTDGGCPPGYVLTIQNNEQYCTRVVIR